jgi:hypothetical protein
MRLAILPFCYRWRDKKTGDSHDVTHFRHIVAVPGLACLSPLLS